MASMKKTDVVVVGAGPVGQLTALRLAEAGVDVTIIDKHWRTGAHSYALGLHSATLRLLDEVGVLDEIRKLGHPIHRVGFYEGGTKRCEMSPAKELDADYPFVLVLPQNVLESALEKQLRARRVEVLWNHRLEALLESDLTTEVAKLDRVACGYPIAQMEWVVVKKFRTKSSFVVGADGYHSVIRDRLGIGLENVGRPKIFSVFEFDSPEEPDDEVRVVFDDYSTNVLWPMKDGRCRWSFQIQDVHQHEPAREYLNARIRERAPWFPEVSGPIHWTSAVVFAQRLASSFGRGRVWLAGDAAHLTSPVGVQSMNEGLAEGRSLADHISAVLKGEATVDSLEEYSTQHHERWRFLLGLDRPLEATNGALEWVKYHASRIRSSVPATGQDLKTLLAQIGLR
jgi:2-polyprenyl-6-methoxyphenol hydroxylase-like FAD-dependent oxidoreductase